VIKVFNEDSEELLGGVEAVVITSAGVTVKYADPQRALDQFQIGRGIVSVTNYAEES
jgi:hypothetical protein